MNFIPAGEIIGAEHQVRTVRITESPQLPDGAYTFIDMYCTDPNCDCRKTMIQVMHDGKFVSLLNYGWEKVDYYRAWMGDDDLEQMDSMAGASIDVGSPDLVSPHGMLGLFQSLLDERWVALFKRHYDLVKKSLGSRSGASR